MAHRAFVEKTQAALHSPEKTIARRRETDKRLREARNRAGSLRLRLQPYVLTIDRKGQIAYVCLPGTAIQVIVAEAVDVGDLLAATLRFWQAWRPDRRRTEASIANYRKAFELLERSAGDLKRRG